MEWNVCTLWQFLVFFGFPSSDLWYLLIHIIQCLLPVIFQLYHGFLNFAINGYGIEDSPVTGVVNKAALRHPYCWCICVVLYVCHINMNVVIWLLVYESFCVSESFGTGHLEQELQMVQFSATRCSCIAILWVSVVSFAVISLCVASQWVIPKISIYFVTNSVWKLLDTSSYFFLSLFVTEYTWFFIHVIYCT
jgi:hypothetical protein